MITATEHSTTATVSYYIRFMGLVLAYAQLHILGA
jgi:hypothetical protein